MKKKNSYQMILKTYIAFLKKNNLYDSKRNFFLKIILKNLKIGRRLILKKVLNGIYI